MALGGIGLWAFVVLHLGLLPRLSSDRILYLHAVYSLGFRGVLPLRISACKVGGLRKSTDYPPVPASK